MGFTKYLSTGNDAADSPDVWCRTENWAFQRRNACFLALAVLIILPVLLTFFNTVKPENPFSRSMDREIFDAVLPEPFADEDVEELTRFSSGYQPPPALSGRGPRHSPSASDMQIPPGPDAQRPINFRAGTTRELILRLKELKLWDVSDLSEIPPVSLVSYPSNFNRIKDVEDKKRIFFHALLPIAVQAVQLVADERIKLQWILQKLNRPPEEVVFDRAGKWAGLLSDEEADFIHRLSFKYRTQQADQLLLRVNIIPISLILAQGAIESSWGGSRFARFGNNLFGIWTWNGQGLIPYRRDPGLTHRVATYDSIRESVRAYLLMLNLVSAYESFRKIRSETMDPLKLAEGLLYYSERRSNYVAEVQQVIRENHLSDYDRFMFPQKQKNQTDLIASSLGAHATDGIFPE